MNKSRSVARVGEAVARVGEAVLNRDSFVSTF